MAQMSLMPMPVLQFFDNNGKPLAGGCIFTYEPGGLVHKLTYRDSTGTAVNPWPIVLDAAGRNPLGGIWISGYYRVLVTGPPPALIWLYFIEDVSSMPYSLIGDYQWIPQQLILTFINATQFSVLGYYSILFRPGERIKATVTGPPTIIYGTVTVSVYNPVTGITTVTCLWSAGALDAGLSAIDTGILTSPPNAIPITQPSVLTADTVLAVDDMRRVYLVNPAILTALLTVTIPAANAVPSGTWIKIVNVNCSRVMVSGTVSGMVNATINTGGEITIVSSGAIWYGAIVHPRPVEFDANSATAETALNLGTVSIGDRFLVTCFAWLSWAGAPTDVYMTTHQGGGTATMEWNGSGLPNSLKAMNINTTLTVAIATKTDVLVITGNGTLTLHNRIVEDAVTPVYDNKIYVQRLRHI